MTQSTSLPCSPATPAFSDALRQRLRQSGVIAVLVIERPEHAVRLAKALLAGGVTAMELTLRTPAAIECLRAVAADVPEMLAGAGTIIDPRQIAEVVAAGGQFGVAPGTNPAVIQEAGQAGLPFAPGVMTPTDIDTAVGLGCRDLKFFPAVPSGGLPMLAALKAPYAHLQVRYIPLGGITAANLPEWLADPDVPAVGGSWLAKKELIAAEAWQQITQLATAASELVRRQRSTSEP
ncbi:MAG: bifunctional 4-hydroxy-2-oxoglutarate aldolase/2-dehydro-3-deoxy-phosphogluconate aldolase [Planctomycetota bacterium]